MITFVVNCKVLAGRRQNCQVYAGRSKKICKVFLGRHSRDSERRRRHYSDAGARSPEGFSAYGRKETADLSPAPI
jgi:hypothetical protein